MRKKKTQNLFSPKPSSVIINSCTDNGSTTCVNVFKNNFNPPPSQIISTLLTAVYASSVVL